MADVKISALPDASTPDGTEVFALVQSGATAKINLQSALAGTNTDATASRALDTTYTNGARALLVCATVRCVASLAGGTATAQGKSDTSNPPTTVVSGICGIQAGLLGEDNSFQ